MLSYILTGLRDAFANAADAHIPPLFAAPLLVLVLAAVALFGYMTVVALAGALGALKLALGGQLTLPGLRQMIGGAFFAVLLAHLLGVVLHPKWRTPPVGERNARSREAKH